MSYPDAEFLELLDSWLAGFLASWLSGSGYLLLGKQRIKETQLCRLRMEWLMLDEEVGRVSESREGGAERWGGGGGGEEEERNGYGVPHRCPPGGLSRGWTGS
jgi:hypothetical protein